jgi:hypothetical protein
MNGIYAFLVWCPVWAVALILYAITDCAVHIFRDWREGLGYQVAYSAKVGDAGLIGAVLIAATILTRGNLVLPSWLVNTGIQLAVLLPACFLLGFVVNVLTLKSRSGRMADVYHDVVIAPLMLFFAVTLLPVIYLGGTAIEQTSVVCLVLLWAVLVAYDIFADRMNQRKWLKSHGVILK